MSVELLVELEPHPAIAKKAPINKMPNKEDREILFMITLQRLRIMKKSLCSFIYFDKDLLIKIYNLYISVIYD
jgi:hypothetical protein